MTELFKLDFTNLIQALDKINTKVNAQTVDIHNFKDDVQIMVKNIKPRKKKSTMSVDKHGILVQFHGSNTDGS
jgi:hypothetical protein